MEEGRVDNYVADSVRILEALRHDRLDIDAARKLPRLSANISAIVAEG